MSGKNKSSMVDMDIRCVSCGHVIIEVSCEPDADVVGIARCPQCGEDNGFNVTDMMAMREIGNASLLGGASGA